MKTRGQKAVINTAVLAIFELVTFVSNLVLPRFILLYFGSDYNGVISSINQFLGFMAILQTGIGGSTRFALYKVLANNDTVGISGIMNATQRYMQKVGAAILLYIGSMAAFYPYLANTGVSHSEIRLLVIVLGAIVFAQYFFGISYLFLLFADQRQYVYYFLNTAATVVSLALAIILMKIGSNIFVVKLGNSILLMLVPIIVSILVRKEYKIDKNVPQDKTGLKGRWDVMGHAIADIIHKNVSLVVLTLIADIKLVSVYSVYQLVVNGLSKILSIFTSSLEAAFGNMIAKKENDNVYKHLENYEFFMCSFVSVVFSCALVLIVPFVKLYTKGVTDVNYIQPAFAAIAVIAQMVVCIRQPYLTVAQAAGHYKQTRNGAFLEAGLNLVITLALTPFYGLVGAIIGTLVANVVRTLQYVFYLSKNIVSRPVIKPLKLMAWTAVNVTIVYFASTAVLSFLNLTNWFGWIFAGLCCFVIALLVTIISARVFFKEKLQILVKMLLGLINKKVQA